MAISKKQVRFVDIAHSMNVHIFIIWEFVRKFGYERGTRKDKYGRGYVSAVQCRKWIQKLKDYIDEQDFTYKQDFNKRQYLYRDENKYSLEKKNQNLLKEKFGRKRKMCLIHGLVQDSGPFLP